MVAGGPDSLRALIPSGISATFEPLLKIGCFSGDRLATLTAVAGCVPTRALTLATPGRRFGSLGLLWGDRQESLRESLHELGDSGVALGGRPLREVLVGRRIVGSGLHFVDHGVGLEGDEGVPAAGANVDANGSVSAQDRAAIGVEFPVVEEDEESQATSKQHDAL